ncbi:hypothetical protein JOC75_001498 [Metabacillus crassostreae]|nr:hypothetical protein [Metabacillus crassostreae]
MLISERHFLIFGSFKSKFIYIQKRVEPTNTFEASIIRYSTKLENGRNNKKEIMVLLTY